MQITINQIKSLPEYITIRRSEYVELKSKAQRYDERIAKNREKMQKYNNSKTKEERSLHARKAVMTRWSKQCQEQK